MSKQPLLNTLAALIFSACALASTQVLADTAAGATAYQQYCQACHQPGGAGMRGAFPPLVDNPNVAGNPEYVAKAVLKGVRGPIEVNGIQYNGVMPPMGYLSDQVIADLANFIEQEWGGKSSKLTAEDVTKLR